MFAFKTLYSRGHWGLQCSNVASFFCVSKCHIAHNFMVISNSTVYNVCVCKSGPYLTGGAVAPPEIRQSDYNVPISVISVPPEIRETISALPFLHKKF